MADALAFVGAISMVRVILTVILLGLLTACSGDPLAPSRSLVQKAIALQINLTQQRLVRQLQPPGHQQLPKFAIAEIAITQQEPLTIQNLPTYHIRGTYNITVDLPKRRVTQQQNPFDVYLQRQIEGKTWRLAVPLSGKDTDSTWFTYLIE